MHSQQPPGVVQNWSTLQCSKQNTEQCGYDHAPVTRGRMRAQFPLPHGQGGPGRSWGFIQPGLPQRGLGVVGGEGGGWEGGVVGGGCYPGPLRRHPRGGPGRPPHLSLPPHQGGGRRGRCRSVWSNNSCCSGLGRGRRGGSARRPPTATLQARLSRANEDGRAAESPLADVTKEWDRQVTTVKNLERDLGTARKAARAPSKPPAQTGERAEDAEGPPGGRVAAGGGGG